ncbi:unnamed protein product [Leptidea sinapis]|uniref:F-ATPase gamma subunit n=1 Tax=Leptidea sinapis TaxID=189913 RepID=A0A5E4Q9V3_9NEOP|nr:unnamed protein product [Leptidea sinapis]
MTSPSKLKFYESSQLVKGPVDQKEKEKQPDIVADKTEDIKDDKMTKRIYVAIGRIAPVFADASAMAAAIAESGYQYDVGEIFYNKYFTPVKYELTVIPFFNKYKIETAPNMNAFDDVDQDQLECYSEWTLAALLYYVLKEGAASEQSARMSAMDNATKNADEMIKKLTLLFNRTRQAVITRELIEIISGAAALE